jgi:hypothetical protein
VYVWFGLEEEVRCLSFSFLFGGVLWAADACSCCSEAVMELFDKLAPHCGHFLFDFSVITLH